MKSFAIFVLFVAMFTLLPGCTDTGKVDFQNPAVQSALSDAEKIAMETISAAINSKLHGRRRMDVTVSDPLIVGAIESAETKIMRKHPEITQQKAHAIAVQAAKTQVGAR